MGMRLIKTRNNAKSTSRISITAHYTGYNWYANGLSHRELATIPGSLFYYNIKPVMWIAQNVLGLAGLEMSLLQRHLIIDHLVKKAIEKNGCAQILELACGLSPRGFRFMNGKKSCDLTYIEADLPDMAALKRRRLNRTQNRQDNHIIIDCDILASDGDITLENIAERYLDPGIPAVIITEGIINYFDIATMSIIWERIANLLRERSGGVYLSDNLSHKPAHPCYPLVKLWSRLVGVAARGRFHLHFYSDSEAMNVFRDAGFCEARVHHPENYRESLPIETSKKPSFIDVIEAVV